MPIWQRERAANSAALKLVRNKVRRARLEVMLFDLDQNRSALGNCCTRSKTTTRTRYCCSIILDNSAIVGSLPFGVNPLTTAGKTCEGRKALLRDGRRRAASSNR